MTMIYTGTTISFQANGKFHQAHSSHPAFSRIVDLCKAGDYEGAAHLVDIKQVVTQSLKGSNAELRGSSVYYKGEEVRSILARRITTMINEGFNATPLLLFLENLMENPSKRAVDELYGFLEASSLPITDDGHFLAYKSVRQDYTDHHSGTMDNSVGQVVSMERNRVDEDKDRTCSYGLHFAAHEYAKNFGRSGRMMVLKINPRDVVAIPSDYENQKGRCARYEVVEEVERGDTKLVNVSFVNTSTTPKETYVPQESNYDDRSIWAEIMNMLTFEGKAKDFPVNRDVPYSLERFSNSKSYRGDFYFTAYDEKNDNLIFTRLGPDGEVEKYVTVSNLADWDISRDLDLV